MRRSTRCGWSRTLRLCLVATLLLLLVFSACEAMAQEADAHHHDYAHHHDHDHDHHHHHDHVVSSAGEAVAERMPEPVAIQMSDPVAEQAVKAAHRSTQDVEPISELEPEHTEEPEAAATMEPEEVEVAEVEKVVEVEQELEAVDEPEPETVVEKKAEPEPTHETHHVHHPSVDISGIDTSRWLAKILPEGCRSGTSAYLTRAIVGRKDAEDAYAAARNALNEARVKNPSGVSSAEKAARAAADVLADYDATTMDMYGISLPKTCVMESQEYLVSTYSQYDTGAHSELISGYIRLGGLLAGHMKALYSTMQGAMDYTIASYRPVIGHYTNFIGKYQAMAEEFEKEASHLSGGEHIIKILQSYGYTFGPVLVTGALLTLALYFAPLLLPAMCLRYVVYNVWVKLFFSQYAYGATFPKDMWAALSDMWHKATASEWAALGDRAAGIFFESVADTHGIFYNGIIAMLFVSQLAVLCCVVAYLWVYFCVPGFRSSKATKLQQQLPTKKASKVPTDDKKKK